ncbi:MAG: hypothetical protein M1457_09700, partial [bacterium]|nr:hypothetical protein [bacterium]
VADYDRAGRSFQAIVQDKRLSGQGELTPEALDMLFMVCYDLDDIIRLKKAVGMSSEDFLDRYCVIPFSRKLKYPIVLLKMADDPELTCPFLKPGEGCGVYKDRPWACRMFPVGRAAPPSEESQEKTFYFMMRDEICEGVRSPQAWTIAQWLDDQGVADYDRAGRSFQAIVQDKRLSGQGELTPEALDMLFMVCYDLDRFSRFVFGTKFADMFEIPDTVIEAIRTDDEALMEFGFQWIRFALWREPTLKVREEVAQAYRAKAGVPR